MTLSDVRAYGDRPVAVHTSSGFVEGRLKTEELRDSAIAVLLASAGGDIVIFIDDIERIEER